MERHGRIDEQLADTDLFRGLRAGKLRQVTSLATRVDLSAGTVITKEGRPGSQFIVLLDGVVAVGACDRVIATRGPGDFLGEISLLGARVQTATTLATTPVVAAVFSKPDFWSLLGEVPEVGAILRSAMSGRLDELAKVPMEPVKVA
jgi:CRP-like cAMP-binding protein